VVLSFLGRIFSFSMKRSVSGMLRRCFWVTGYRPVYAWQTIHIPLPAMGYFFCADVLTAGRMSNKRNNINAIVKWLRGMSLLVPMLLLAAVPAAADEMSAGYKLKSRGERQKPYIIQSIKSSHRWRLSAALLCVHTMSTVRA